MADVQSNTVVERKATRPTIITPSNRPPVFEASPTGHKKIPKPPQKNLNEAYQCLIEDLSISDEDATAPPVSTSLENTTDKNVANPSPIASTTKAKGTILITALRGSGVCGYKFQKGPKKGETCLKRCNKGLSLCGIHRNPKQTASKLTSDNSKTNLKPPSITPDVQTEKNTEFIAELNETKSKLARLEKVVDSLLKVKKSKDSRKKHYRLSERPAQKIRIYKLKHNETYKLIRYENGMPVLECSKNKLYIVPLPKYINRPIPNGKWSLVGGKDKKMEWKEV